MQWTFLLLSALLAPVSQAQGVHKIIGPDGRITFTDRPPASAQSVHSVGARPIARNGPAAPLHAQQIGAALQVYHKQVIVDAAKEHCRLLAGVHRDRPGTVAASAAAAEAATRWHERHAALVRQKDVVLYDQLTRDELLKANEDARTRSHQYMSPTIVALVVDRIAWCQALPKTLASPEFDLAGQPDLVRRIMDYTPVKYRLQPGAPR